MYSIIVLICSTALSRADCQAKTAVDVARGPTIDNPMMCAFNAQTMIARTERQGRVHAETERRAMDGRNLRAQGCDSVGRRRYHRLPASGSAGALTARLANNHNQELADVGLECARRSVACPEHSRA
jgi:hypothetical protein